MSLPRMRTAAGVLAIIKEQDPGTEVTMHYIRNLIKTRKVPVTPVGSKKLVDADVIIAYIAAGETATAPDSTDTSGGGIRMVPV